LRGALRGALRGLLRGALKRIPKNHDILHTNSAVSKSEPSRILNHSDIEFLNYYL